MSFYGGGLLILLALLIFIIVCPSDGPTQESDWSALYSGMDTYYFIGVLCFVVFATGFNI